MQVEIKKPSIKTLWLDTSIIIKIAIWKAGQKLNDSDQKRVPILFEECSNLVEAGKLICPIGEQQEEIWKGERICHEIITQLSLGAKFKHNALIERAQTIVFMEAFTTQKDLLHLSFDDAFFFDPVEAISRAKFQSLMFSILPSRVQTINEIKQSREQMRLKLEQIRAKASAQGSTFENQLAKEYQAKTEAYSIIANETLGNQLQGLPLTSCQYEGLKDLYRVITWWDKFDGSPKGLEGILEFLNSEYHRKIPHVDIQCKLGALLLTDNSKLETGDSMDITHISSIMPYCQGIIVDRKMKNRCHRLKFDDEYKTRIFSLNDFDEIMNFLRS